MNTAATNKALLQSIYAALASGDGRPLREAMAEDFSWTIAGHSAWSHRWSGREAVLQDLLAPLTKRFATRYRNHAQHFVAEGDTVVVQCRGEVRTTGGEAYDNHYCMVYRVTDGRLRSVIEYMDTDLACRVLGAPGDEPPHAVRS